MKITAVIMAGGKGERFWPKSRSSLPKQFLSLTEDGKTMIQLTVERLLPLISYDDIFIAANKNYAELIKSQLPEVPEENILAEPFGKNTAPCIGFAAAVISRKYDDAVMLVLPSDHLIKNKEAYIDCLKNTVKIAEEDCNLVTVGITPSYPETGYGYIKYDKENKQKDCAYSVMQFAEKPDADTAEEYVKSGNYLWNSGMFAWKTSSILHNFKELMSETYNASIKIKNAFATENFDNVLHDAFSAQESVSIDYGIMEKADNIFVVPGDFGWDDVGSWLSIKRINKTDENGNVVSGDVINIDTANSIIMGEKKLIAAVGIDNLIIIDTKDALLILNKDSSQNVKKVIEKLREDNRLELL